MFVEAKSDLHLDLESSIINGDKLSDIQAGCAAGVGTQAPLSSEAANRELQNASYYVFPFAG
jgi:histidinol phosphatase-like enzyme